MKLVIREYLSMLRESGELDALLPDLLLAMGLNPISRPKRGVRQYGVDLPAVGIDPADGHRKLFLFTVKRGNLTRSDWDSGPQAVRPSLNEILDTYLQNRVRVEHMPLPKKIVLVTGGELSQEVEPSWRDYVAANRNRYPQYGELEFDFWGGDQLADLIERHFLDEYLFPESAQKQMRKSIALADQNEDEPRHFYALIEDTLFGRGLPKAKSTEAKGKRLKALRLLNLSLNIIFHWCREADNLRPALLAGERMVLRTWDWMRQQKIQDRATRNEYARIFETYLSISRAYADKLRPYVDVRDGLFGFGADEIEYPLRTFEVIGILGVLGMALTYSAAIDNEKEFERLYTEAEQVTRMLANAIRNNPSAYCPRYDGHAVDIALGLLALTITGRRSDATNWVQELANHILFAYRLGRNFPISTDAYEDLVAMQVGEIPDKTNLMELSTLLPMLAEWYAVLDLPQPYAEFRRGVAQVLPNVNLQLWHPDDVTEEYLYRSNAAGESGATLSSIELPEEFGIFTKRIARLEEKSMFETLSAVAEDWPVLGLVASRHFRTPVIPSYWRTAVQDTTPFPVEAAEKSNRPDGEAAES